MPRAKRLEKRNNGKKTFAKLLRCRGHRRCEKRKTLRGSLDTCAQTVYTRAIESKGADGSNSASAFCVFGWILPSGEIEGPLREMHRSCVHPGTGNGTRPQGLVPCGITRLVGRYDCYVQFRQHLLDAGGSVPGLLHAGGFCLCEAGFTRAKNTGNILMKNMMDFCIGTPCYWVIGFGLMFGGTGA